MSSRQILWLLIVLLAIEELVGIVDATGVTWRSGDIFETAAITVLLTMMFVAALALVKIVRGPDETRGAL